jgi:mRNA-degrading endonuclease RelE of RelBE toxin-antitoxin system
MYDIGYLPKVFKQLQKIPKVEQRKIMRKIELIALDPFVGKALEGNFKGSFSFRAWPYRIIYMIEKKIITIYSISHRQSSYKK